MVKGWKEVRLGDVADILIGGTPSRNNPKFWDNEKSTRNLWVSIKDLNQKFINDTEEYITDEGVKKSNVKLIKKDTLLLSFKLSVGKVAIAGKNLYTNEAIAGITKIAGDNNFFYFGFQYWDLLQNIEQAIKGITLNKDKLNNLKFFIPTSKTEQEKIAKILTSIDNMIEVTSKIVVKQKRIKTGLMQDLLTYGIDEDGNIRSEETHEFKDSPLGKIPIEWEVEELGNISKITDGSHFSPEPQENGSNSIINVKDLKEFTIDYDNCTKITNNDFKTLIKQNCYAQKNDILLSKDGTIGKVLFYDKEEIIVLLSSIAIIRMNKYLPKFLSFLLKSFYFDKQLILLISGSALKRIVLRDINKLIFPFPTSQTEQQKIASILSKQDEVIEKEEAKLKKLKRLKTALMQDLLTAKVRVKYFS